MKAKLLQSALALYILAIGVTAITHPAQRIYWPLYLPLVVIVAFLWAARRR